MARTSSLHSWMPTWRGCAAASRGPGCTGRRSARWPASVTACALRPGVELKQAVSVVERGLAHVYKGLDAEGVDLKVCASEIQQALLIFCCAQHAGAFGASELRRACVDAKDRLSCHCTPVEV